MALDGGTVTAAWNVWVDAASGDIHRVDAEYWEIGDSQSSSTDTVAAAHEPRSRCPVADSIQAVGCGHSLCRK
jgi:hypothetical protein